MLMKRVAMEGFLLSDDEDPPSNRDSSEAAAAATAIMDTEEGRPELGPKVTVRCAEAGPGDGILVGVMGSDPGVKDDRDLSRRSP